MSRHRHAGSPRPLRVPPVPRHRTAASAAVGARRTAPAAAPSAARTKAERAAPVTAAAVHSYVSAVIASRRRRADSAKRPRVPPARAHRTAAHPDACASRTRPAVRRTVVAIKAERAPRVPAAAERCSASVARVSRRRRAGSAKPPRARREAAHRRAAARAVAAVRTRPAGVPTVVAIRAALAPPALVVAARCSASRAAVRPRAISARPRRARRAPVDPRAAIPVASARRIRPAETRTAFAIRAVPARRVRAARERCSALAGLASRRPFAVLAKALRAPSARAHRDVAAADAAARHSPWEARPTVAGTPAAPAR